MRGAVCRHSIFKSAFVIARARAKLCSLNERRDVLIIKKESAVKACSRSRLILKRKLDLVLIQREAARRGARLALITRDLDVIDNASELNISTFSSVRASQRGTWKRPISKVFIDRSDRPDNAPDAYELMLAASRLRVLTPQQRQFQRVARLFSAAILGIVLLIAIYLLVPSADVTISVALPGYVCFSSFQISATYPSAFLTSAYASGERGPYRCSA